MKFFYDCEFHEDGSTIDLISIGIVAENGDSLYRINRWADWDRISDNAWLREHVLPFLPGGWVSNRSERTFRDGDLWRPDGADERVRTREEIAEDVRQFIASYGESRDEHELWAYYGAYDHVTLCQLWGRMMALPNCVPMFTNDIMQVVHTFGLNPNTLHLSVPQYQEHDALADANWNLRAWQWLREHAQLNGYVRR